MAIITEGKLNISEETQKGMDQRFSEWYRPLAEETVKAWSDSFFNSCHGEKANKRRGEIKDESKN